jgi:hypothetical protein
MGRGPAGLIRPGCANWMMQSVPSSCAIPCPFFPLAKLELLENFLVAHQVADDGKEVDVYLNLAGDEEFVGGMGSSLADVVPFEDGRIEEGRLGECLLHGALERGDFDQAIRQCQATRKG